MSDLIPQEILERKIYLFRGQKVMLDGDLAELYGVPTKILIKAVKRNLKRFPADFMYRLTRQEVRNLRFQFGTSSLYPVTDEPVTEFEKQYGGRRHLPYVFTEQGIAMLSSVLNSERAIQVNIAIMRAFVRLRGLLSSNKELAKKLEELEKKYDAQFKIVFDAIRDMMTPEEPLPEPERPKIGFHPEQK